MPSIRELRGRIRSVQNIQKITKAMKLVAAARQKKAQDRVTMARPYSEKIGDVMRDLVASTGGNAAAAISDAGAVSPAAREAEQLLMRRDVQSHGLLVISGERGLCGSYNTNILRRAMETIRGIPRDRIRVIAVGKKAIVFFQKRGYRVVMAESMPAAGAPFDLASKVGAATRRLYASCEVDTVHLVFTRSLSAMSQRPTVQTLLPVEIDQGERKARRAEYLYEPSAPELLSTLVPRYVDTLIYQAILDANAGEQGARMIAMSSATDNAKEVETRLTLVANRVRQAAITNEILEVVGGAEALRD